MDAYDDTTAEDFSDSDDDVDSEDNEPSDVVENNELDVFTEISPRPYQSELEKKALSRNTIIHLPTGSGKTFIAVLLIKRTKQALALPYSEGGKRTFFLVNTVPLVEQQVKVIKSLLPLSASGYSSEDNVDYWDYEKWLQELDNNQVLVMTSQILLDMLNHKYVELSKINLLIFDECHQAVDEHPMRQIMRAFEYCPVSQRPRVLGLTAILLNTTVSIPDVTEKIKMLETTFHATIATVGDLGEVLSYSTDPVEIIIEYELPPPSSVSKRVVEKLRNLQSIIKGFPCSSDSRKIQLKPGEILLNTTMNKLNKIMFNIIEDIIKKITNLGLFGGSIAIVARMIQLERIKRNLETKKDQLLVTSVITHIVTARAILEKEMENTQGFERVRRYSSDKILRLLSVLIEYNPARMETSGNLKINISKVPLSAIIFTQERFESKILYTILKYVKKSNPRDFGFLEHEYVVGFNIKPNNDTREDHFEKKHSLKALLKFSRSNLNVLIATQVLEEGIDIQRCSLVIRYDPPLNYRSYIQSKGRARSRTASYVILLERSESSKFKAKWNTYQKIEEILREHLVGKSDYRSEPSLVTIEDKLYDQELDRYFSSTGASVTCNSAISLVSRYCMTLKTDKFTNVMPYWVLTRNNEELCITITMPVACAVKQEIKGQWMSNTKLAKQSAALETCKLLHQAGELTDNLLPISKKLSDLLTQIPPEKLKELFANWPVNYSKKEIDSDGLPGLICGTKKCIRKHPKVYPKSLDYQPQKSRGGTDWVLHIIKLNPAFAKPDDSRESCLYQLLQKHEGYGILTTLDLPTLCDFPMFLNIGEVSTSLQFNYKRFVIEDKQLNEIKRFHYLVFNDILGIAKKFLVYSNTFNNYFVVPIHKSGPQYDINWSIIKTYKTIETLREPTAEERQNLNVKKDEYYCAVVTPWYRGSLLDQRYIVTDVQEYRTPLSPFPSDEYDSYEAYYQDKYNLSIYGSKHQPMLEVKCITGRMTCLLPRAATINTLSARQVRRAAQAQGDDTQKAELFVPEYCVRYSFPGIYWYKATILPSILHRMSMLLLANDLRAQVSMETGIGLPVLPPGGIWKPITIDIKTAAESLLSIAHETESTQPSINQRQYDNTANDEESGEGNRIKVSSMKNTIFELQMKKLDERFDWDKDNEPIDIFRNMLEVTPMDIECYDKFISQPMHENMAAQKAKIAADQYRPTNFPPICPPPAKYNDKIKILSARSTKQGPELKDILQSITCSKSNDAFNFERMETLGDAFLKFAATLYLWDEFPELNEGQLTSLKGRLIGNKNLFYAGRNRNLGGMLKAEQFSPRNDFELPSFAVPTKLQQFVEHAKIRPTFLLNCKFEEEEILEGSVSDEALMMIKYKYISKEFISSTEEDNNVQPGMQIFMGKQALGDKNIADSVEALIGTYVLHGGPTAGFKILEWFDIIPRKNIANKLLHISVPTAFTKRLVSEDHIDFLLDHSRREIENILGYKFKDPSLLLEALSHPSYIKNRFTNCYEKFEFLGDALLDFLITSYLYENYPELTPGKLTDLRSALVNNVTFACYVVRLGLHRYLQSMLNAKLDTAILKFVEHQIQRQHCIDEQVLYLLDEPDCHLSEYVEVPKTLSDIFESLAGAIYLDSNGNLELLWQIYYKIMWREIDLFSQKIPKQPVRMLYEHIHAAPIFGHSHTIPPRTVMVPVRILVQGKWMTVHGFGSNKFQAKRAAAKIALRTLGVNT